LPVSLPYAKQDERHQSQPDLVAEDEGEDADSQTTTELSGVYLRQFDRRGQRVGSRILLEFFEQVAPFLWGRQPPQDFEAMLQAFVHGLVVGRETGLVLPEF
jgi:hypothetical protein